jgi:hypothetical protein
VTGDAITDMYTALMMHVFNILWDMQPLDAEYKPFLETYTVCWQRK